jgi:hypothetical protein
MDGSISRVRIGDGTFRYRARYRDPSGRQHERRFPRKVDAQRWLDEATSALVTRTWTAPERGRVTVAEWAERWLAAQTGLKPSTHYRYGTLLRAHKLPAWGNHRLADVTHSDVATWVAQLRQRGSAPGTVRHAHRVFSLLLDLAVRDGRIPRNPAQRVPLPRIVRDEPASSPGTRSRSLPTPPVRTATSSASWPTQVCASASSPRCVCAGSTSYASA